MPLHIASMLSEKKGHVRCNAKLCRTRVHPNDRKEANRQRPKRRERHSLPGSGSVSPLNHYQIPSWVVESPLRQTEQVPPFFMQFVQLLQFLHARHVPFGLHLAAKASPASVRATASAIRYLTVSSC